MATKKWSHEVMEHSDALDLESGVFLKGTAAAIAKSLKRSAEHSARRKGSPFQSAMSMLNFYINRGGKNLSATQKNKLEKAKDELRKEFGREQSSTAPKRKTATRKATARKKTTRKKTTRRKRA